MEAEGLAMRPGPRPRLAEGLLALLREALKACRVVTFRYRAQSTGRRSLRRVQPYGLLYGNRTFLVGRTTRGNDMRLWRLSNMSKPEMTEETFTRDQDFDLRTYARRSFGVFQEEPMEVVPALRRRDRTGRQDVPLPSGPDHRQKQGQIPDGAVQGRAASTSYAGT